MDPFTPPPSRHAQQSANMELEKLSVTKVRSHREHLTPPVTPTTPEERYTFNEAGVEPSTALQQTEDLEIQPIAFNGCLELEEEIGRGAWSKVFSAREKSSKAPAKGINAMPTPPGSPAGPVSATRCYAVKTPSHGLALSVVKHEALILSKLTRAPGSSSHIVRFYGFEADKNSIVMSRASETLGNLASTAFQAESRTTTRSTSDPVIGLYPWLDISLQLVRGLAWIHQMGVIHGDIKASNILLVPSTTTTMPLSSCASLQALYCDFSSSRLSDASAPQPPAAFASDAITTSYASPELLKSYSKSYSASSPPDANAVATESSDVWALAVTLVVAAVGVDPYAHAGHTMRKLSMAKEGMVIEGVRMGNVVSGMRVRKGGIVERVVKHALAKKPEARIGIRQWDQELEDLKSEIEAKNVS